MKRPEGHSSDHVGLGTLSHFRTRISLKKPNHLPGIPAGLVARSTSNGISLTWVKSVDPITAVDADSYEVYRANQLGGSSRRISNNVIVPNYHDTSVKRGELYFYSVKAKNSIGISLPSVALAANAGLPNPWLSRDIGDVQKSGFSEFNGERFTLEGEGADINGKRDSFHFAYAPFIGEGTITARIVRPMSSQWTKPGVMMRETLDAGSRHASVLLLPHWRGALVARGETGEKTSFQGHRNLGEDHVVKKIDFFYCFVLFFFF